MSKSLFRLAASFVVWAGALYWQSQVSPGRAANVCDDIQAYCSGYCSNSTLENCAFFCPCYWGCRCGGGGQCAMVCGVS